MPSSTPGTPWNMSRLRYSSDSTPGISRQRHKGRDGKPVFSYRDTKGRPLRDAAMLTRIRALAIPPAYEDVWICPHPRGHLQATGRDARGRKQYRYHPLMAASRRTRSSMRACTEFGRALPGCGACCAPICASRACRVTRCCALVLEPDGRHLRARGQRGIRPQQWQLRPLHIAGPACALRPQWRARRCAFPARAAPCHEVPIQRQAAGRAGEKMPAPAGPAPVPVSSTRMGRSHAIDSGQVNAYLQRASGWRFLGQGLPHLACHAAVPASCCCSTPRPEPCTEQRLPRVLKDVVAAGRRAAAQHARRSAASRTSIRW